MRVRSQLYEISMTEEDFKYTLNLSILADLAFHDWDVDKTVECIQAFWEYFNYKKFQVLNTEVVSLDETEMTKRVYRAILEITKAYVLRNTREVCLSELDGVDNKYILYKDINSAIVFTFNVSDFISENETLDIDNFKPISYNEIISVIRKEQ